MSRAREAGDWERALAEAQVVVLGPAPPLRGGIAAHTARLVEHLGESPVEFPDHVPVAQRDRHCGGAAAAASYCRLYPNFLFPGRSQRGSSVRPPWCEEVIDVVDPRTWWRLRSALVRSRARIVLQWWHPVTAPALLAITAGLARQRLVAVCHNALPHEAFPGAAAAARAVLGRCGLVLCHSGAQAAVVRGLLGAGARSIAQAPLPCLLSASDIEDGLARAEPAELVGLPRGARIFVAAGHQRVYKGGEVLLAAWTRAQRPAEARLVLVGESYLSGKQRRRIEGLVEADPSIVLVDRYVEDAELVRFLDSAEALVAPHLAASQSGLIPIARALSLPCIVSDAGGLVEQARAEPDTSEVVPVGDVAALAAVLESRLDLAPRRRRRIATTARGDALRDDFAKDWRRVVEAMGIAGRP